jgi:hypothetical protein
MTTYAQLHHLTTYTYSSTLIVGYHEAVSTQKLKHSCRRV